MSERIESMKQFIEQQPDNPFPRYALALELKSAGLLDEAVEAFAVLRERMPAYVPTYLQYGMVLESLGRIDEAREVLTRGVEVATAAGDNHARSEIESALDGLD